MTFCCNAQKWIQKIIVIYEHQIAMIILILSHWLREACCERNPYRLKGLWTGTCEIWKKCDDLYIFVSAVTTV